MTTQHHQMIHYCRYCELEYPGDHCARCPLCPLRQAFAEADRELHDAKQFLVIKHTDIDDFEYALNALTVMGWVSEHIRIGHSEDRDHGVVGTSPYSAAVPTTPSATSRPMASRMMPRWPTWNGGRRSKRKPKRPSRHGRRDRDMATNAAVAICSWCGQPFRRLPKGSGSGTRDYCSALHYRWARSMNSGKFPVVDCPRCGRHDMRVAAPDWAICQTCGYQSDRHDREPGTLTPRGSNLVVRDLREHLGLPARLRRA